MVRGTYLPWPVAVKQRYGQSAFLFRLSFLQPQSFQRTSLGEESAEAGVGVSLLAFLGQVSIGLLSQMVGQPKSNSHRGFKGEARLPRLPHT